MPRRCPEMFPAPVEVTVTEHPSCCWQRFADASRDVPGGVHAHGGRLGQRCEFAAADIGIDVEHCNGPGTVVTRRYRTDCSKSPST